MSSNTLQFAGESQLSRNGDVVFTSEQIFILSKMANKFRKQGKNYKLTNQEDIENMLSQAYTAKDMDIRKYFEELFNNFPDPIKQHYNKKASRAVEFVL